MWRRHHLGLTPTPLGESAGAVCGPVALWSLTNATSGHRVTGAARLSDAGAQRAPAAHFRVAPRKQASAGPRSLLSRIVRCATPPVAAETPASSMTAAVTQVARGLSHRRLEVRVSSTRGSEPRSSG